MDNQVPKRRKRREEEGEERERERRKRKEGKGKRRERTREKKKTKKRNKGGYLRPGSSLPWREGCCRWDRAQFCQSNMADKTSAEGEREDIHVSLVLQYKAHTHVYMYMDWGGRV